MLEKNKDYVEMRVSSTDCAFTQNAATTISIEGFSYDTSFRLPDPGESYVIVSKEKFEKLQESEVYYMALSTRAQYWKDKCERLQADNEHYREMAKQWEENYNLLFKKTGFDTVESLVFYLTNVGCDTLLETLASYVSERDKADENYNLLLKKTGFDTVEELVNYLNSEAECDTLSEAIASLEYNVKFARDERRNLSKKLDECEKDYISERDKAEALQTENEQLKKKLEEFSPAPAYKEFLKALYPEANEETIEKLIWVTKHSFGGRNLRHTLRVDLEYYRAISSAQAKSIYKWKEVTGFSSCEEIEDYLTNEAECDTLHEAISKLHDQVKYTCEEWYSANSNNNSWKVAAECNSPKELIEKREALEKEIEIYSRALKEWKEGTCCPSPSAAKTLIESGMSYEYAYHEAQKENRKLTEEVDSWKNVTGYSIPEDYMHARINCATPFDYTAAWQDATGCSTPLEANICIRGYKSDIRKWKEATKCDTPEKAKERIKALNERIDESEADYNHLLCTTGFESEGEIEDFLEQNNDRSKLTTVIDNLMLENETMKTALRASNLAMQKELDHEIDKWQKATGCIDPETAKQYIDRLKGRLNKIHGYSVDW